MNEFKVTRVGEIIRTGDLSCKVDFDVAGNTYLFTIEFSEEPGNTAFTCRNVNGGAFVGRISRADDTYAMTEAMVGAVYLDFSKDDQILASLWSTAPAVINDITKGAFKQFLLDCEEEQVKLIEAIFNIKAA